MSSACSASERRSPSRWRAISRSICRFCAFIYLIHGSEGRIPTFPTGKRFRSVRNGKPHLPQLPAVSGRRRSCGKYTGTYRFSISSVVRKFGEEDEDYRLEIASKQGIPTMGRAGRIAEIFEYLVKLSAPPLFLRSLSTSFWNFSA